MEPLTPLEEQILSLPSSPGVYVMKDPAGAVLYVGKAKNLRNRVRSYIDKNGDARYSLRFLMPKVSQVETLLTDTEKEALLLENTLIKKHKPRYNINLKDDKTYFSLKFSLGETFPKLSLVRRVRRDGARYFGPFASGAAVKETLRLLHRMFPLRTCSDPNFRNRSRPCLNHQMKKCFAPCCGLIAAEKYGQMVQEVLLFLEGRNSQLVKLLRDRMNAASEALEFEEAARVRDQILAVERTLEKQKTASPYGGDQDVFSFHRQGNAWEFEVLFFRRGLLLGNQSFHFSRLNLPDEEALSAFLRQYYARDRFIPGEVLLPLSVEDEALLGEWLSEKKGERVNVFAPQRGEKRRLVELARKNAANALQKRVTEKETRDLLLKELRERLSLKDAPRRVECFDISNLFGTLAVGSMVVFLDGQPDKSGYRRFKVLAPSFPDDYAMMYEVLRRRYAQLNPEEAPDLLIVDGGKGQLNVALAVLAELDLRRIPAIGLAKEKSTGLKRSLAEDTDKVYLPNVKDPLLLPPHSAALRYLQGIRDEAHRFAITYHKKLRGQRGLQTLLEEVPGIGAVKRKALLRSFSTLQHIQEAAVEDLGRATPLTRKDAETLHRFFHPRTGKDESKPAHAKENSGARADA